MTDDNLRVFSGRDSSGVRGIRRAAGDEVISLSVLRHVETDDPEDAAAETDEDGAAGETEDALEEAEPALSPAAVAEIADAGEILLTVTNAGFGKRTPASEYRVTRRSGQGISNIKLSPRNGTAVAASFPVRPGDDVMLVTDEGRLIRVPADQVRVTGRASMGVRMFRLGDTEHVISVFPVVEVPGAQTEDANSEDAGSEDAGGAEPSDA